jgi:hypothetical protein
LKYEILTHTDAEALAAKVNAKLQAGWKTAGGVAVVHEPYAYEGSTDQRSSSTYFAQAVIAEDP